MQSGSMNETRQRAMARIIPLDSFLFANTPPLLFRFSEKAKHPKTA